MKRSLWRLPELNAVAFWVLDPAELAVFGLLDFRIDVAAFSPQRCKESMKVVDTEVDHEAGGAWREVRRVFFERAPDRCACAGRVVGIIEDAILESINCVVKRINQTSRRWFANTDDTRIGPSGSSF